MQINPVELVAVDQLRANPANPKGPLGTKYRRGLRESLTRYGFAGIFVVAANDDGSYEVLDGNTRLDEVQRAGIESVPCVVYKGMSADERRKFVLAHDRHRKQFDEEAVLQQLEQLAANGEDLKQLAVLSGKDNLERLLAEASGQTKAADVAQAPAKVEPMSSLTLYGPAADVGEIKALLKQIKGGLAPLTKARKALRDAREFLQWDDERLLLMILSVVARLSKSDREGEK